MKKLIIITGAPGVGKTTLCKELFKKIEGSAWLDSDWCWMINPWTAKTHVQKEYVEQTFTRILRGYLLNESTNTIIFSWVIKSKRQLEIILEPLADIDMKVYKIALICNVDAHKERMKLDNRRAEQVNTCYDMEPYYQLEAEVIDISELSVEQTLEKILITVKKEN